jgi:hypothetical protein
MCAGDTGEPFRSYSAAERVQQLKSKFVVELYRGRGNFWKRGEPSRLMQRVRTSEGLCTSQLFGSFVHQGQKFQPSQLWRRDKGKIAQNQGKGDAARAALPRVRSPRHSS